MQAKSCFDDIHTIPASMPFVIFPSGSFAVQFRDHFLSMIICGPIWGSFAVPDHLQSWDHLRTRTELQYERDGDTRSFHI